MLKQILIQFRYFRKKIGGTYYQVNYYNPIENEHFSFWVEDIPMVKNINVTDKEQYEKTQSSWSRI